MFEKADRYKRLLGPLFTEEGVHLNRVLVSLGLASVTLHPPNLKYSQRLIDAQVEAERMARWIWSKPAYEPMPVDSIPGSKSKAGVDWLVPSFPCSGAESTTTWSTETRWTFGFLSPI